MAFPVRLARNTLCRRELAVHTIDIPTFLCPALLSYNPHGYPRLPPRSSLFKAQRRCLHLTEPKPVSPELPTKRELPIQCTGCGAFAQMTNEEEPGFYSVNKKTVKAYLQGDDIGEDIRIRRQQEENILVKALQNVNGELAASLNINVASTTAPIHRQEVQLLCERCHRLTHHHAGVSIHHPTITSIQDTLFESPFKYNHVYHVLDAADFPMSLVPQIHHLLDITPQRSLNRRSKSGRFYHGRKTEMSFIITRSDLFAPLKAQVDSLMPYLTEVLRDALGRNARDVRLGNVRCVSAKRDWWTRELKDDIWKRGGGGWMVGKVNVGKSQLFSKVFPKGRSSAPELMKVAQESIATTHAMTARHLEEETVHSLESRSAEFEKNETKTTPEKFDPDALLPPALAEVDYPPMPLVSSLPGTTASPIRVPFGGGKGELIDLPGLSRGDLELHVQPEHRSSLVMRSRVVPEQRVIKPGQSLLLGGLIRITPTTPDLIFLGYAFTPISDHLTSSEKAIAIQQQHEDAPKAHIISLPETAAKISSAGKFKLKWDVTKQRSGPVTRPNAGGIRVEVLPYRVLSIDILIEGCGWVELVAQVRKKDLEILMASRDERISDENESGWSEPNYPEVEVFSPEGRFIAARRPMNGWLLGGPKKKPASARKSRPRPSKKGEKKRLKTTKRLAENRS